MTELVFLIEELSAQVMLEGLLPSIAPEMPNIPLPSRASGR